MPILIYVEDNLEPISGKLSVPIGSNTVEALSDAVESAWGKRETANLELLRQLCTLLLEQVIEHYPEARTVVIREDTSHLPAHGHLDAILDVTGNSVLAKDSLDEEHGWPVSLDESAWEIYFIAPQNFIRFEDGVKRFTIVASS